MLMLMHETNKLNKLNVFGLCLFSYIYSMYNMFKHILIPFQTTTACGPDGVRSLSPMLI